MNQRLKLIVLIAVGLIYVGLSLLLFSKEEFWVIALPAAIATSMLFFFDSRKVLLIAFVITPLSFRVLFDNLGFSVNIPGEPLVLMLMAFFLFKLILNRKVDKEVFGHPITIVLLVNLLWLLFTSITSEMPVVSIKFFLSRFWYVGVFFFFTLWLLKTYPANRHLIFYYAIPLALVVLYITYLHGQWNFDRRAGTWLVRPFFGDHTNYAATLALVVPIMIGSIFNSQLNKKLRWIAAALSFLFLMGIVLSFSRAAWLSVFIGTGVGLLLWIKIPRWLLISGVVAMVALGFMMQPRIRGALEDNPYQSSGNIAEHVRSISNVTTDASNLERINRWRAAIRMFQESPLVGWGPGTYQFVYAPFQLAEDFTIITTHFGDLGNAHSEYLGPLSESGLPGMLLFIALAIATLYTGIKLRLKGRTKEIRMLALTITISFVTYFVHGLFNNFLDTDKAAVPFWSLMAILVALDVYHQKVEANDSDVPHLPEPTEKL